MISQKSFDLFSRVVNFGYWTAILPYKCYPEKNYKVEVVKNLRLWRCGALLILAGQWILPISLCLPLLSPETTPEEIGYAAFPICGSAFIVVIELYNLVYAKDFAQIMTATHLLAIKLGKIHKISST